VTENAEAVVIPVAFSSEAVVGTESVVPALEARRRGCELDCKGYRLRLGRCTCKGPDRPRRFLVYRPNGLGRMLDNPL
jgi:hypothetical protein